MTLRAKVRMSMVLYNKNNMEPLKIVSEISGAWDEDSAEYKILCDQKKEEIGYERGTTTKEKDKFDEELLRIMIEETKQNMLASVERIVNCVKQYYAGLAEKTVVEYGGYIIDISSFCAVKINPPTVEIEKH